MSKKRIFTKEELNIIQKNYENGNSIASIANKFNCSHTLITKILYDLGIYKKTYVNRVTKYSCDNNYFNNIDSENKAYFLGLIASDGCIHQNHLSISCNYKDKYILELLKNELHYNGKLYYSNDNNYVSITITSDKLTNDLKSIGIIERKTFTINIQSILEKIPKNLISHFMRGYFDGDGCISYWKSNDGYIRQCFKITCTIKNSDVFKKYFNINTKLFLYKKSPEICDIRTGNIILIKNIYKILYSNANIYLIRKQNKFQEIFNLK